MQIKSNDNFCGYPEQKTYNYLWMNKTYRRKPDYEYNDFNYSIRDICATKLFLSFVV